MPYQNPYLQSAQYMPYQPQGYMTAGSTPMLNQQQQTVPPVHGFVYVTGLEGAKAYQMPPNSDMPLFDSTNDGVMFIKTTDGAGFPTITVVDCKKREAQTMQTQPEYVTHDELERVYSDLSSQMEQMKGAMHVAVSQTTAAAEQSAGANAKHSAIDGR